MVYTGKASELAPTEEYIVTLLEYLQYIKFKNNLPLLYMF